MTIKCLFHTLYMQTLEVFKFQNRDKEEKKEITNGHEACGFGYQVVRCDGESHEPVIYRGEHTVEVFLNNLDSEYLDINNKCSNPKPIITTEEDEKKRLLDM